jgi:hypothetical protein
MLVQRKIGRCQICLLGVFIAFDGLVEKLKKSLEFLKQFTILMLHYLTK